MADATAEMTIDELARESGMTARNIRAHQSRGLLPPPAVRARTGYYGADHLARIRLIQDMQAEGFNLKSIERLLDMGARGGSRETLEFQRAILEPFGSEEPEVIDGDGIAQLFGNPPDKVRHKTGPAGAKVVASTPRGRWQRMRCVASWPTPRGPRCDSPCARSTGRTSARASPPSPGLQCRRIPPGCR